MKKILLAYDGGEPAKRALEQTIELATRFDAEVGVISVVPVPLRPHRGRPLGRPHGPRRGAPRGAKGRCVRPGSRPRCSSPAAMSPSTIERVADERGYDTIVIGTRGVSQPRQDAPGQRVGARRHPRPRHRRRRPLMRTPRPATTQPPCHPARVAAPDPGGSPRDARRPGHAPRPRAPPVAPRARRPADRRRPRARHPARHGAARGPGPQQGRGLHRATSATTWGCAGLLPPRVVDIDAPGRPGARARPAQGGRPRAVHRPGGAPGPQRDPVPPRARSSTSRSCCRSSTRRPSAGRARSSATSCRRPRGVWITPDDVRPRPRDPAQRRAATRSG